MGNKLTIRGAALAAMLWPALSGAAPRLETVSEQSLRGDHSSLARVWNAVGMMRVELAKRSYALQTGFFIAPNKFVTFRSPDKSVPAVDCSKEVVISTGFFRLPNHDHLKLQPTHRCVRPLASQSGHGFTVLQVEPIVRGVRTAYFPLATIEDLEDDAKISLLGYSFHGNLTFAGDCTVETNFFVPDDEMRTKNPNLELVNGAWAMSSCFFLNGMFGSPILVRKGNGWAAAGILSPLISQGNASSVAVFDLALFPKIPTIAAKYGADFRRAGVQPSVPLSCGASGGPGCGAIGSGGCPGTAGPRCPNGTCPKSGGPTVPSCPGGGCPGTGGGAGGTGGKGSKPRPNHGASSTLREERGDKLTKAKLMAARDLMNEAPSEDGSPSASENAEWRERWQGREVDLMRWAERQPRDFRAGNPANLAWAQKFDRLVQKYLAELP